MVANTTNITNGTSSNATDRLDEALFLRFYYAFCAVTSLCIAVGTPLCLWLVSSILTSPEMRRRLRNQLICASCISYVLQSTVAGSLEMAEFILRMTSSSDCRLFSFMVYFRFVVELASAWLFVILLAVFMAQVLDFDPTSILTPRGVFWGKVTLLAGPGIISVIFIPSFGALFKPIYLDSRTDCMFISMDHFVLFRSLDYLVPLLIAVILLIVACVLYYRRFHRGMASSSSQVIRGELMSRGRPIDNVLAYVVVSCVDIALRLPSNLELFGVYGSLTPPQSFALFVVSYMVLDTRSMLSPWGWLLLDDVRERLKVWRPWYRPKPGIDLTVAYTREDGQDR